MDTDDGGTGIDVLSIWGTIEEFVTSLPFIWLYSALIVVIAVAVYLLGFRRSTFRRDSILGGRLSLRLYNAIPNLLTGFGILGTLLGLVAGISLASDGPASSDPADAKDALQTLLDGAALAFGTSIAGLLASIMFSMAEKRQLHALDLAPGQWHSALEQRLRRITPEEFAQHQLAQTLQQTDVLKGFTEPLAFQIADQLGKQFEAQVTTAIAPALNALVEGVKGLREDHQRTDADMLGRVLEQFTTNLRGAAGTEMESMAETLSTLNDKLIDQAEAPEKRHLASQEEAQQSMERQGALFTEVSRCSKSAVSSEGYAVAYQLHATRGDSKRLMPPPGLHANFTLERSAYRTAR